MTRVSSSTDPRVRLLRAAADPNRLAILLQLATSGAVCACELGDCCSVSQPTLSHHLKVLREAGWIEGERRGTWIWYSLRPEALAELGDLVERLGRGVRLRAPAGKRPSLTVLQPV